MADDKPSGVRTAYAVLMASAKQYGFDRVSRMGAALSYRTFFAAAPLLFFAVAIFGQFLGSENEAEQQIVDAVAEFAGEEVADAVSLILQNVQDSSGTAALIGAVLLLWTASSLFLELQNNLNDIFGVPYEHTAGMLAFIRKRGIGFLWVFGLGLVLVLVWLVNFAWRFFEGLFPEDLVGVHSLIQALAPLVSLLLFPVLIALIFRTMILRSVPWRALWSGAFFTSVTFLVATYVMGLYFEISDSSATAVVGSIFVILLLAYTLASVFLFGAIVTRVYADYLDDGNVMQPSEREKVENAPRAVVTQPEPALPSAVLAGFLGGLLLAWRRKRR